MDAPQKLGMCLGAAQRPAHGSTASEDGHTVRGGSLAQHSQCSCGVERCWPARAERVVPLSSHGEVKTSTTSCQPFTFLKFFSEIQV